MTTEEKCLKLHEFFNGLPRYRYPFEHENLPANGVYVLFENGERYHNLDRIVLVGTNESDGRLRTRLNEHFSIRNRSCFRRKIGCALLNRDNDDFCERWNDLTRLRRFQFLECPEEERNRVDEINNRVTEVIRVNFSFAVFILEPDLDTVENRMDIKQKMIATLAQSNDFVSSENWMGRCSPTPEVQNCGLWLVNFINGEILSDDEMGLFI